MINYVHDMYTYEMQVSLRNYGKLYRLMSSGLLVSRWYL